MRCRANEHFVTSYHILLLYYYYYIDESSFLEKLEEEARKSFKDESKSDEGRGGRIESLIGLHLLLSKGQSPMLLALQPQISNNITSSYLSTHHGIELNTKLEGYADKYIAYLRRAGIL